MLMKEVTDRSHRDPLLVGTRIVLALACAAAFMGVLEIAIVNSAAPSRRETLGCRSELDLSRRPVADDDHPAR